MIDIDWQLIGLSFVTVFPAKISDKSQLAAIFSGDSSNNPRADKDRRTEINLELLFWSKIHAIEQNKDSFTLLATYLPNCSLWR